MTPNGSATGAPVGLYPASPAPELRFTERMAGFVSAVEPDRVRGTAGGTEVFRAGWAQGCDDSTRIEFVLTIRVEDLDALLVRPATPADVTGTAVAPALSPTALTVVGGQFRLLVHNPDRVETWNMFYDLSLVSAAGERFELHGFKVLRERPGFNAWRDTTTLFVTVTSEHPRTRLFGIMRLTPSDLVRQVRTMQVLHVRDSQRRLEYLAAFLKRFAHSLIRIYGGPLDEAARFPQLAPAGSWDPPTLDLLKGPVAPELHWMDARKHWHRARQPDEYARLCLTRYPGGSKGPVMLAPGFGMAASSFLTPTIKPNLVEFLVENAYDVWLFDYRASINLPKAAASPFTLDNIATEDWPDGVEAVKRLANVHGVQVVGHCVGSVTLLMGLLSSKVTDVCSVVCSQFTTQPMTSRFNLLKAYVRVSQLLGVTGARYVEPPVRRSFLHYALDIALRAVPMAREERCGLAECRWINAVYGLTHRHAQLNDATHQRLIDEFGISQLHAFSHIAVMMRKHRALSYREEDIYLPQVSRLERIPIHFLIGEHNYIFFPPGSFQTIRWLKAKNPRGDYGHTHLREYAHLDGMVGRDASKDVYPAILDHLNRTQCSPPSGGEPSPTSANGA
jgi:cholesterol oxidase